MDEVIRIKTELEKAYGAKNGDRAVELMKLLFNIDVTMEILGATHIGLTVNKIRKSFDHQESVQLATKVVRKWKKMAEQYKNTNPSDNNNGGSNNNSNDINGNQDSAGSKSKQQTTTTITNTTNTTTINTTNSSSGGGSNQVDNSSSSSPNQNQTISDERQPTASTSNPHESNLPMSTSKPKFVQREVPQTNSTVRLKFRQMICEALKEPLPKDLQSQEAFLDEEELSARIEDHIFQEFKSESDKKYGHRVRSRICNLKDKKNPYLRLNVIRGDISAERIARMTAEEMASDELKRQREKFTKEAINDHQMAVTTGTRSSEIKCPACKKYDCTYNQMQTRSADEPMTTFCHCNNCGKRWKFC